MVRLYICQAILIVLTHYLPFLGGQIFAVCGPETFGVLTGKKTQGYIIDIASGKVKETFNADGNGFQNPHDVAVTKDGSVVYEVELRPFKVWKLTSTAQGGKRIRKRKTIPTLFKYFICLLTFRLEALNPRRCPDFLIESGVIWVEISVI